jgi:hypothetical protein
MKQTATIDKLFEKIDLSNSMGTFTRTNEPIIDDENEHGKLRKYWLKTSLKISKQINK